MKIYLICPVRNASFDSAGIVRQLEDGGHTVHFPPRDVDQSDPVGIDICNAHAKAMRECDAVGIVWDVDSKGSHFDLGMAFILSKPVTLLKALQPDVGGKSYLKVIKALSSDCICAGSG